MLGIEELLYKAHQTVNATAGQLLQHRGQFEKDSHSLASELLEVDTKILALMDKVERSNE
ncbi:hypothetical protein [Ligilactobacillus saerimneri]|uniref:hypothetical protein n=1 Tax=Ligilactobacillus saerimneri TaxID=228229 RepID=UPI001C1295E1|nr:hypothetical protein [Ligilactobacillus saerimneri]MBU5308861.1 hypothetical protein [Ligilactobacillus saerimneri]